MRDQIWFTCTGCGKERRTKSEGKSRVIADHRRWNNFEKKMEQCPGSGQDCIQMLPRFSAANGKPS